MDLPVTVYQMAFASLRGINAELASLLLERCGSEREFFELPARRLADLVGRESRIFDANYRQKTLDEATREYDFVELNHIRTCYFTDPDYPQRLREAVDAPLMLYSIGSADLNSRAVVGIVGTRHMTPYGADFTRRLVSDLKELMTVEPLIVSGLAFGIDVAAHNAALSESLPTAAVLAHGLNTIYPAPHRQVAAEMVHRGGMLLTDYRSIDQIHKGNFLARNRIVAGLCDCLVVVESAAKGGALVTANIAAGYNRDVFAVPGRTGDRYSAGCNSLISRHIAQLITSAEDLVAAMRWPVCRRAEEAVQKELFPALSPDEQTVVNYLDAHGEATLNRLSVDTAIPIGKLMAVMIDLEFKNLVIAIPGGRYRPSR